MKVKYGTYYTSEGKIRVHEGLNEKDLKAIIKRSPVMSKFIELNEDNNSKSAPNDKVQSKSKQGESTRKRRSSSE